MGPKKKTPTFEEGGEDWKTVLRKFRTGEYDVASFKASNIRALEPVLPTNNTALQHCYATNKVPRPLSKCLFVNRLFLVSGDYDTIH